MEGQRSSGYVIVEGNIGVGKSTFSRLLAETLRAEGLRAEYLPEPDETTNPFLSSYYADPARYAYKMQMHLLHQRFKSTRYAQAAALADRGWYILDRSYYGDICFANVQVKDGYFTTAEQASYLDAHRNMREFIEPPTCAVFLHASPETCARRMAIRGRTCEAGVPLDYLRSLHREIEALEKTLTARTCVVPLEWNDDMTEDELRQRIAGFARHLCTIGREDWDF